MSRASKFFRRLKGRLRWRDVKKGVVTVVAIQSVVHVMQEYGYFFTWCVGPSMMPTIPGDGATLVFLDSFSYKIQDKEYEVGDVVICASPSDANKNVCKRIAAKSGDYVTVHSRNKHHRVRAMPGQTLPSTVIPPGHVWLAGDNSQNSTDSRTYGPVPIGLIKGKVTTKAILAWSPFVRACVCVCVCVCVYIYACLCVPISISPSPLSCTDPLLHTAPPPHTHTNPSLTLTGTHVFRALETRCDISAETAGCGACSETGKGGQFGREAGD